MLNPEKENVMSRTPLMVAIVILAAVALVVGIANATPSVPLPPP
jgi:hypothetical protein